VSAGYAEKRAGSWPVKMIEVVSVGAPLSGRNGAAVVIDSRGQRHVFKQNTGGGFRRFLTDEERRRRDICNILASRILYDVFDLPAVIYYDAELNFHDGSTKYGIVSDYIEGLRALEEVGPNEVVNREDALMQIILLAWLGDLDRIDHPDNEWVDLAGRYITLDFDFCFSRGVKILGLPNASRRALERFATRDVVARLVTRITTLSDDRIRKMVDRAGAARVRDWTPRQARDFASVLIHNRNRMARGDAFLIYQARGWRRAWAEFVFSQIFKILFTRKSAQIIFSARAGERIHRFIDSFRHPR
jgi:hypothetical protein